MNFFINPITVIAQGIKTIKQTEYHPIDKKIILDRGIETPKSKDDKTRHIIRNFSEKSFVVFHSLNKMKIDKKVSGIATKETEASINNGFENKSPE